MNRMARSFASDLAFMLALSDQRKAENRAARIRMQNDSELVAMLESEARRRGVAVDWQEYFRNAGV